MDNSNGENFNELCKRADVFLNRIGMFSNLKGYTYLLSAIKELAKDPLIMHSITKELYPRVAKNFQATPIGVERSIRNAIETTCNKGKLYLVANTYYNGNFSKYEKPTNGEFIAFLFYVAKSYV